MCPRVPHIFYFDFLLLWVMGCHHPQTTLLCHDGKSDLACEQALRSDTAMGWEKEGELATMSLEFEFHLQFPCGSPSTVRFPPISVKQKQLQM